MWRKKGGQRGLARALVVGLAAGWAAGVPAHAQEALSDDASPVEVITVPKRNEFVLQTPRGPIRVREPGLRTHENLFPFAYRSEEGSIPTRGLSDRAVDVIYHVTLDFGQSSAIRTRRSAGTRVYQPIVTHPIAAEGNGSAIRYHGGFR